MCIRDRQRTLGTLATPMGASSADDDPVAKKFLFGRLRFQISASGASAVGSWEKGPGSVFSLKSTKVRTDKPGAFRRHQLTKGSSAFSRGVSSGFLGYSRPIYPARARESAAPARRRCRSRTTSSSPRGAFPRSTKFAYSFQTNKGLALWIRGAKRICLVEISVP